MRRVVVVIQNAMMKIALASTLLLTALPQHALAIVQGKEENDFVKYPFFAHSIQHNGEDRFGILPKRKYFMCGASLIHQQFLLTAAHCGDKEFPSLGQVMLNTNDLDDLSPALSGAITRTIKEQYEHPLYDGPDDPERLMFDFLLLAVDPVDNITPVALSKETAKEGDRVQVMGFGKKSGGASPDDMHEATITVVDTHECRDEFVDAPFTIDPTIQFCHVSLLCIVLSFQSC